MLYNEEIELDEDFEGVDDSGAEVVTEFDEIYENTDYDNNYTYVDIDFPQDTPELIETPDPVVDPVVEEEDPIPDPEYETISETYEIIIQEYSQEYLQELEDSGYTFYVVYEDGTEDEVDISEIEEPTTNIEFLDDEAYVLANSILEHFWDDSAGVHVTQDSKEAWAQLVEDNFPDLDATHPHHNIIVNSYGVLIRSALKNLVQLSRSALAFYDGLGNNSSNIISTFGRGGIQIGPSDQKHLVINNNGITVYNGDGTVAPLTASNIQAIEASIQTLTAADVSITNRLTAAEGDIDTLETNTADIGTIRANSAKVANLTAAELEADHATVGALDTNYAHLTNGVIDNATIGHANVNGLSANYATIANLNTANGRITTLEATDVTINGRLDAAEADIDTLDTNKANVTDLTAATARIGTLETNTADIATIRANAAKVTNLTAAQLEADHATVGALDTNYAQVNMANVNNAWIQNGTVKDGAITNAMIHSVSANKLTAGTIDASNITVTNLNADNITAGTLNGQRIGAGTLSLDKLDEDVYTETEVDGIVQNLQTQIDGAIETWTGTVIPTLQNAPAVNWNTNSIKDTHVGDVYFVVNSQSQQNGYNYRFTKTTSGGTSTYSWQLIKDNDVTNALQRLTDAEGRIGTIETFDTTVSSFMSNTDTELSSIKSAATTLAGRVTTAEGTLATKVDTTTFNTLSQTVDGHSSSITQLTTETTTLTQAVDTLNTKTSSDSGNIVQFDNSIGFKEIVVHGNSVQTSYTGKNLLNTQHFNSRVQYTSNEDNSITINSSDGASWDAITPLILSVGTYTISWKKQRSGQVEIRTSEDNYSNNIVAAGTDTYKNFTLTSDGGVKIKLGISVNSYPYTEYVQLELGSTATDYEPYVGGKPSPNPDYPQEINSIDDLTINTCGKNLAINSDKAYSITTSAYAAYNVALLDPEATEFVVSVEANVPTGQTLKLYGYDSIDNGSYGTFSLQSNGRYAALVSNLNFFKKVKQLRIYSQPYTNGIDVVTQVSKCQLEVGSTATTYEPYQGHSIDIPLGDHQIRSLPDGTDDTLTFSYIGPSIREGWGLYNAELVQKVGVTDLGTLNWLRYGTHTFYASISTIKRTSRGTLCTSYRWKNIGVDGLSDDEYSTSSGGNTYVWFRDDAYDDAALFKASVSGVMFDYILATPVTHSLGVVELPLSEDLNLWASTSPSTTIDATWWHEPGRAEKNAIDISLTSSNLGDAIDSTTLPAPYTEVEWVESNGAQYVYLDWKPPIETWGFEADFIIRNAFSSSLAAWNPNTNANGYGNVFGTRNASGINDIQLGTYSINGTVGTLRWGQAGYTSPGLFKTDKTRQQISLRGTTLTKADGTTVTITRSTENDSKFYANMAVFCMHEGLRRGGTGGIIQPGSVRIYSLKFYDGDELKVDLVGALRNRDGITGLYDKVKDHFYPAYGMTYGDVVGDLGIPDTILEAVAKSKINVHIDNRQISRMWRAEVPELNRLEDGQTISVTFSTNIGATTPVAAGLVGWDETATTAYANVFLKLVLADETETDWIPCFYAQGTRLTSHYGSGTPILLTYRENVLYGASTTNAGTSVMRAWYADPNYVDGNTQYPKYSNSVIAGLNGIKRYTLCMKDQNGKWTSIINQANTVAATKTCYTGGLQLDTILYYSPANEIAAGNNSSDGLWESFGIIDWRYSFNVENNATNGLAYRTPLYLVGTLSNSDGLFYLDTTKWWTQTPNDPTKIYIWVSAGYTNWYQGILSVQNTVYAYDEDAGLIEINVSRYSKTTTKLNQTIDTVDEHTQKIGVLETTVESKADGSDLTTVSNTLNTVSQTATSNSQKITNLTTRLGTNADGTAGVNDIIAKESALEQDLDGFKTTVSSTYTTKTEFNGLEIGGRNLLRHTKHPEPKGLHSAAIYDTDGWYMWNNPSVAERTDNGIKATFNTNGNGFVIPFVNDDAVLGETDYILSFDARGTFAGPTTTYALARSGANWQTSDFSTLSLSETEWTNVEIPVKWPSFDSRKARAILFPYNNTSGKWIEIRDGSTKFEKGNRATDWTPAPEDTDAEISGLKTRVTTAESSITQNATNIELKVAKDSVISSINQSAEMVKIQASKVEIDGTAIFSNTAFRQAADTAYDAKGSAQTVQNNLDNLEIGGRNLFTWPLGGTKWKDEEHALTTYQNHGSFMQFTGSLLFDPSETVGEQYTISFWAKSPNGTTELQIYNKNGVPKYFWIPPTTLTTALDNEWEFFSLTVTNTEYNGSNTPSTNETYWRRVEIYAPNAIGVLVKQIKVEKGNRATDWTPAPEDVAASAVKRTQRIWYRKSAVGAPATPGAASSNWVTKSDDGSNAWTKMHVSITTSEKYIYTCEQYEMADGTVGYTSVLLDNTITVIDGGSIITRSVTADQIAAGAITTEKLDTNNLLISTGNIEDLDDDLSGIQEHISSVSLDLYGGVTDDGDEVQSVYSIINDMSDTIDSNMKKAGDDAVDRAIQSIQEDLTEYVTKEKHQIDIKALDDDVQSSSSLLNTISTDLYGAEATEGSDKIDPIFVTSTVLDDRDEQIDVKIDNKARDTLNAVDKSYASTKAEFTELKGYIAGYVDETTQVPMLVLGQRSGAVQAILTNSVLDFIASTDDVPVASIGIENGNGLLKVTRANIGELNIGDNASGHWQWQQRQNGNLALKFISESE